MSRKIDIRVDPETCVGNALCQAVAAVTFVPDDNGRASVAAPNAEPVDTVLEAAAMCPVGAITVMDADSHEPIPF